MLTMADVSNLLKDAAVLARRAVENDQNEENYPVAIYFYVEATTILDRANYILDDVIRNRDGAYSEGVIAANKKTAELIQTKINEYRARTIALDEAVKRREAEEMAKPTNTKTEQERLTERAYFLVDQALQSDEKGEAKEAVDLYTQAVEMCLQALRQPTVDAKLASKINAIAKQALTRAEVLKGITNEPEVLKPPTDFFEESPELNIGTSSGRSRSPAPTSHAGGMTPGLGNPVYSRGLGTNPSAGPPPPKKGAGYTDEEKKVLLTTSLINGREYVPFMSVDLGEKFAYPLQFTDGGGKLQLAPKQRKHFTEWARPGDLYDNPKMIEVVSPYSIKQTVISDCSFVASLAVSALYERRFNRRLITGIIYPQNKNGDPVYNPCGKYMVKLHLNGVKRKVIIDDFLPIGQRNDLLCSYSSNRGELWVSLLEKAYMKVMGGYDFPGSNSNIDLHALTGWIPERIAIHPQEGSPAFEKNKVFDMLAGRMAKGDVLVTVATGQMDESEADRAGLVTCHAYAVLDVRVISSGVRLVKLKNPWSHLRWKGNYSELDATHWMDQLKSELNYDPNSASLFDNGVFWIDYDSVCKFFDVFYLNWNPKMFAHTNVIHKTWSAGVGPVKDVYNIGENPQYSLKIESTGPAVLWVLLTRHITEIEDFKENREYITVLVYDSDGKRVFYPYDPPPLIDGVRINSPHYLCKIPIKTTGIKRFTLVISQYAKMNTIHYTLRSFSNFPTALREIPVPYKKKERIDGQWKGKTAGGCSNHPETYPNNPCYQIALNSTTQLRVELRAPKTFQVGFDIMCSNVSDHTAPGFFNKKTSGSYRPGFVVLELEQVPSGVYNIIPSTYHQNTEGPFFLTIQSIVDFSVKQLN